METGHFYRGGKYSITCISGHLSRKAACLSQGSLDIFLKPPKFCNGTGDIIQRHWEWIPGRLTPCMCGHKQVSFITSFAVSQQCRQFAPRSCIQGERQHAYRLPRFPEENVRSLLNDMTTATPWIMPYICLCKEYQKKINAYIMYSILCITV